MKFSKTYKRIFGVGPVGLITTFLVWALFFYTEKWIGLPPMKISGIFRIFLLVVLGLDAVYLYVGGMIVLMKNEWGKGFDLGSIWELTASEFGKKTKSAWRRPRRHPAGAHA